MYDLKIGDMQWHYASGGKAIGPVGVEEMRRLISAGSIGDDTLVWRPGFEDWKRRGEVDELAGEGNLAATAGTAPFAHSERRESTLQFSGTAGEYFRVWIVNVALTVITLGIYAAWAKVRKRRYLYGNTLLDGRSFEYTGNPVAILKGNLIVFAGLVCYVLSESFSLFLALSVIGVFALIFPWLMHKALRFNAHNTLYRNVRFVFGGTLRESYGVYLGWGLLSVLTLFIAWPVFMHRARRYQYANLNYGRAAFRFGGRLEAFYRSALAAAGILMLVVLAFLLLQRLFVGIDVAAGSPSVGALFLLFFTLVTYLAAFFVAPMYFRVRTGNHCINTLTVPGLAKLRSSMRLRDLLWIEFSNGIAVLLTLGLALPWATIRRVRYRVSHLHVEWTGDIESVAAAAGQSPDAVGDSASDIFDFDIAL